MATVALTPLEAYLRSDYEPDAEYVDGEIEQRPMGEWNHASWQQALQWWFLQNGPGWNLRVRAELRVQVGRTRYRVPDVTVVARERPVEQILTHPPVAVFEVLSPEDRMPRMLRKLDDYERMGIPNILVIHPLKDTIQRYSGGAFHLLNNDVEPLNGSSGFLDWTAIRAALDL